MDRPARRLFLAISLAGLAGIALALPYFASALAATLAALPAEAGLSPGALLAAQALQLAVLVLGAAWVGARLHARPGLDAPFLRAWAERRAPEASWRKTAARGLAWGSAVGAALLLLAKLVFAPLLPGAATPDAAWWMGLLASFYGGITEEVLLRWGLMTALAWILVRVGLRRGVAVGLAVVVAALLFALAHFPAAQVAYGGLTPAVVAWVLVGNALGGLVFGALYARHGLETAMAAHFVADLWLHVLPLLVAS